MTTPRTEQFEVLFDDGWRAERLPIGLAAGRWWVTFVLTRPKRRREPTEVTMGALHAELESRIRIRGVDGHLNDLGSGGSGNFRFCAIRREFEQGPTTLIEVEYVQDGSLVARESVRLL